MDIDLGRGPLRRVVRRIERQCRRAGERRAHQCQGAEHIGPHERAPSRDRGSEIVPGDQRDVAIAERRDETQGIPDRVQNPKGSEIAVVVRIPPGGAPIASQIGRHDMEPRRGERQHDLSPGIGELRKAVQQQDQRPPLGLKAGLQHVYPQSVDVRRRSGNGWRERSAAALQRPPDRSCSPPSRWNGRQA